MTRNNHYHRRRNQNHRQQRHKSDMNGFETIESFFSDIFSCGACDKHDTSSESAIDQSYVRALRPIELIQQNGFYRKHTIKKNQEHQRNHNSNMIACDSDDDDYPWEQPRKPPSSFSREMDENIENSFLNDTGTTFPDSFLLDADDSFAVASCSSSKVCDLPNNSASDLRLPLQPLPPSLEFDHCHATTHNPSHPWKQYKRKKDDGSYSIMVPTETNVNVWPPIVPQTHKPPQSKAQMQQDALPHDQSPPQSDPKKQKQQHNDSMNPDDNNQEVPIAPIRPPKIKRLTLDFSIPDSVTEERLSSHSLSQRSRSLDFLCTSVNSQGRRKSRRTNTARQEQHLEECLVVPDYGYQVSNNNNNDSCNRGCEVENTRQQLLEMLSDIPQESSFLSL